MCVCVCACVCVCPRARGVPTFVVAVANLVQLRAGRLGLDFLEYLLERRRQHVTLQQRDLLEELCRVAKKTRAGANVTTGAAATTLARAGRPGPAAAATAAAAAVVASRWQCACASARSCRAHARASRRRRRRFDARSIVETIITHLRPRARTHVAVARFAVGVCCCCCFVVAGLTQSL